MKNGIRKMDDGDGWRRTETDDEIRDYFLRK